MDDLPILDRTRLDLITRGRENLANEFLAGLFEEGAELIGRLRAVSAGTDRLLVADLAHTLKGMAGEVGALRLRARAAALEAEPEPSRWSASIEAVNAALAELRAHLDAAPPG